MYICIWPCAIHWVPQGKPTLRGYSIECGHTYMHARTHACMHASMAAESPLFGG